MRHATFRRRNFTWQIRNPETFKWEKLTTDDGSPKTPGEYVREKAGPRQLALLGWGR